MVQYGDSTVYFSRIGDRHLRYLGNLRSTPPCPVLRVRDAAAPLQEHGEQRGEEGVPQEGVAEVGGDGGKRADHRHYPHQLQAGVDVVVRLGPGAYTRLLLSST